MRKVDSADVFCVEAERLTFRPTPEAVKMLLLERHMGCRSFGTTERAAFFEVSARIDFKAELIEQFFEFNGRKGQAGRLLSFVLMRGSG